jgi:hypothetical protein
MRRQEFRYTYKFIIWAKMKCSRVFTNETFDSSCNATLSVLWTPEILRRIHTKSRRIIALNKPSTVGLHFASVSSRLFKDLKF